MLYFTQVWQAEPCPMHHQAQACCHECIEAPRWQAGKHCRRSSTPASVIMLATSLAAMDSRP